MEGMWRLAGRFAGAGARVWRALRGGQAAAPLGAAAGPALQALLAGPVGRLLRHSPIAWLVLTPEGVIVDAGPAAEGLYRCGREDLVGQPLSRFAVPEARSPLPAAYSYVLAGTVLRTPQSPALRADGTTTQVACTLQALGEEAGPPVGILVTLEEVEGFSSLLEELEKARRAANEANEAKSAFLASASHELRTPLNAILGYVELLLEEDPDLPLVEVHPDLQRVQKAGRHLLRLVEDILDLSRIESGRDPVHPEAIALGPFLDELADTVAPLLVAGQNRWRLELPEGPLPALTADPTRLRQVLLNLLGNACKFTQGGEVALALREAEGQLIFAVADDGPGIPTELQAKLFEPFERGWGGHSQKVEGAGLGLALVRRLVGQMGGAVRLHSAPGRGSTFEVRLPPHPRAELAEAPKKAATDRLSPPLALVVEPDPLFRTAMVRAIELEGFAAVGCGEGTEAIASLKRHRPRLLLCDWRVFQAQQASREWAEALGELPWLEVVRLGQMKPSEPPQAMSRAELLGALTGHLALPLPALAWSNPKGAQLGRTRPGQTLNHPKEGWPLLVAVRAPVQACLAAPPE